MYKRQRFTFTIKFPGFFCKLLKKRLNLHNRAIRHENAKPVSYTHLDVYKRQFLSCVLNAENGYEATRHITPAASSKKIAIIGAGIAGLEAARVAALRGCLLYTSRCV